MFLPDFMIEELCLNPLNAYQDGQSDILHEIVNPLPLISNFDPKNLGAASYDIAIGTKFASTSALQAYIMRGGETVKSISCGTEIENVHLKAGEQIAVVLEPSQVVLCHSVEEVCIPPTLSTLLFMRSSFAREWLDHSSATGIWPGFRGQITFELRNHGSRPYTLKSGMRPLQIAFAKMVAPARNGYNGLYQNQKAQLHSKMEKDKI
jgi:deoxycytidine triphosphate deaminase